jgi:hypothetical protein
MLTLILFSTKNLENGGLFGFTDPWFWIFFISFGYINLVAMFGIWGVYVMIKSIKEISKQWLHIDPLHPDKVGGLSSVGNFAISTTVIFSSGALWIPLAIELAADQPILANLAFGLMGAWMILTLLCFAYPTFKIHTKASKIQKRILNELRLDYAKIRKKVVVDKLTISNDNIEAIGNFFKMEILRKEFKDYQDLKLYPFEIKIFTKLVSSVLLPLLIWLLQTFLPGWLGF